MTALDFVVCSIVCSLATVGAAAIVAVATLPQGVRRIAAKLAMAHCQRRFFKAAVGPGT